MSAEGRARSPWVDQYVAVGGGRIDVRVAPGSVDAAPVVLLHEGLGSVSSWRRFPDDVRRACGGPTTMVHSRHGHGRSAVLDGPRTVDYMHREALHVLPALLDEIGIERPVLVGHSDGASIALIHAGAGFPTAGLVLLAPHVFVEDETIAGIEAARTAYATTALRGKLERHHHDVDATFHGWNDVWLSPAFRSWNIEDFLPGITVPVLLIQGDADQYGTLAQLDAIERGSRGPVDRLVLPGAGHAPHVDNPGRVVAAVAAFHRGLASPVPPP